MPELVEAREAAALFGMDLLFEPGRASSGEGRVGGEV